MSDPAAELVVEADLIEPAIPVPAKGEAWVISLTRYTVVRVLEGRYPHSDLFVGHDGVDPASPGFEPGVRHRLWLTPHFPEEVSILSATAVREGGAFLCLRFELV